MIHRTSVISCDLCSRIAVRPWLKNANEVRVSAGWRQIFTTATVRNLEGSNLRSLSYSVRLDICPRCAQTREGFLPLSKIPLNLNKIDPETLLQMESEHGMGPTDKCEACEENHQEGYNAGYQEGYEEGKTEGYEVGYETSQKCDECYQEGYSEGHAEGNAEKCDECYQEGYSEGHAEGHAEGAYDAANAAHNERLDEFDELAAAVWG